MAGFLLDGVSSFGIPFDVRNFDVAKNQAKSPLVIVDGFLGALSGASGTIRHFTNRSCQVRDFLPHMSDLTLKLCNALFLAHGGILVRSLLFVNILVYGLPATGDCYFVKLLARAPSRGR
jgi:hypothetical protein